MHNREHIVIVRPGEHGMLLHTMYFADEVRRTEEFRTDVKQVKEKELTLAKSLVESLAADFEPEKYHDTYRDNLRRMIEAKVQGHNVVETPQAHIAPVVDIMEALKKSLEARKPVRTASAAAGSHAHQTEAVAEQPRKKRAPKVKTA
jgi:DNA end-binding protein Ku